ncbi:hypothetical protein [Shewanella sp. SR44-3]|uniref:hypothetical protein n=1 Tax=unclassified Shewanella TaxID=196818 RepID=UPI0015F80B30|nr:hypothetical protein [Shewanella sp. SR44-3]MBB1268580.1 hypothetical protein [Shewanella sp. SR44-3]
MGKGILKIYLGLGFTALVVCASACSSSVGSEIFYELTQPTPANDCQYLLPEDRDLCLIDAEKRMSYEEYMHQRQQIITQ